MHAEPTILQPSRCAALVYVYSFQRLRKYYNGQKYNCRIVYTLDKILADTAVFNLSEQEIKDVREKS